MAFIDYYKILGVDKNIQQKDVRKAFLKRAKQFHPDLHPDDPKAKAKFFVYDFKNSSALFKSAGVSIPTVSTSVMPTRMR